jgi:hypothetical protein
MPSDSGYTRRRYEEDERRSVDMDDHHRSWTKRVTMPMDVAKAILDLSGSNGEKIRKWLEGAIPEAVEDIKDLEEGREPGSAD